MTETMLASLHRIAGGNSLRGFAHASTIRALRRQGLIYDVDTLTDAGSVALARGTSASSPESDKGVRAQKEIHGPGRLEHTMCGLAPEAFETGDHEEPVVFAAPGQLVTCSACRNEIDHVREVFKGYRYRPAHDLSASKKGSD